MDTLFFLPRKIKGLKKNNKIRFKNNTIINDQPPTTFIAVVMIIMIVIRNLTESTSWCCAVCCYWHLRDSWGRSWTLSLCLSRSDGRSRRLWSCPYSCRKKKNTSCRKRRRLSPYRMAGSDLNVSWTFLPLLRERNTYRSDAVVMFSNFHSLGSTWPPLIPMQQTGWSTTQWYTARRQMTRWLFVCNSASLQSNPFNLHLWHIQFTFPSCIRCPVTLTSVFSTAR